MPIWTQLTFGSLRWQVLTAWQERLFGAHGLRVDEWRAGQMLQIIKQAPHRTVYRIGLPDTSVYIKHYPVADLRALVRQRLRPTKARTELTRALALRDRAVPTVEPLAFAEHRSGESYLITRGLDGTQRLDEFIQATLRDGGSEALAPLRFELARKLARFLARLHDAGVLHQDLHAGNLLIRAETLDLFLIDLHDVRLTAPLSWPQSMENLVLLNRWLTRRTSRADRRRFWSAYVQARMDWRVDPDEECARARRLEAATRQSCLRLWKQRARRCVTAGTHFYRLRARNADAWAVADLPRETLRKLLDALDEPFTKAGGQLLKHGRTSSVAELLLDFGGERRSAILKRFNLVDWSDRWAGLFRASPARRSWLNGQRLLDCGLPTARPLALIQRRHGWLLGAAYLLAEKLEGVADLASLAQAWLRHPPPDLHRRVRAVAEQVAWLVRGLHERQLSHRDLKAANVLVQPRFDGRDPLPDPRIELRLLARPRVYLVDLVGVRAWRKLPMRHRVQNLARLHVSFCDHPLVSRTEKLRFLRNYLGWGLWGKRGWKEWWRAIAAATQRKIVRNLRRGRPVA